MIPILLFIESKKKLKELNVARKILVSVYPQASQLPPQLPVHEHILLVSMINSKCNSNGTLRVPCLFLRKEEEKLSIRVGC